MADHGRRLSVPIKCHREVEQTASADGAPTWFVGAAPRPSPDGIGGSLRLISFDCQQEVSWYLLNLRASPACHPDREFHGDQRIDSVVVSALETSESLHY